MTDVYRELLPIFVYGTLKRGEERESCWPRPPLRVEPATTRGRLYDLGPYPGMVPGSDRVLGELWFLAEADLPETLRVLDEIECYGIDEIDLYTRVTVECETLEGRRCRAYTYHYAESVAEKRAIRADSQGMCQWSRNQGAGRESRPR